jgi:hypothetical protein
MVAARLGRGPHVVRDRDSRTAGDRAVGRDAAGNRSLCICCRITCLRCLRGEPLYVGRSRLLLGSHLAVAAWVKNDRLGFVIPYRKEGTLRKYLPDFVVELQNGGRRLIVEIKGQVGDAAIKKAAAERWCRAVNNDGRHGNWGYRLCYGAEELKGVLDAVEESSA